MLNIVIRLGYLKVLNQAARVKNFNMLKITLRVQAVDFTFNQKTLIGNSETIISRLKPAINQYTDFD